MNHGIGNKQRAVSVNALDHEGHQYWPLGDDAAAAAAVGQCW